MDLRVVAAFLIIPAVLVAGESCTGHHADECSHTVCSGNWSATCESHTCVCVAPSILGAGCSSLAECTGNGEKCHVGPVEEHHGPHGHEHEHHGPAEKDLNGRMHCLDGTCQCLDV